MNVGVDAHLVGLVSCPVNETLVVVGKEHPPLSLRKMARPSAQPALFIDITFMTAVAVSICASIHRIDCIHPCFS